MNLGFAKTLIAAATIVGSRFVKLDASGAVVLASAGTDDLIGISDAQKDITAGNRVDVFMTLQPQIEAGAAIAPGQSVTADANGKGVPAVTGDTAGGFAVDGADADGDIITVHIVRHKV